MLAYLKKIIKKFINRPANVRMGIESQMLYPRWLCNPAYISIGDRCFIGRCAAWNPIRSYEGMHQEGEIRIGNDVHIGGYSQLHSMYLLEIGDGSVLSEYVYVSDTSHGLSPNAGLIMRQPLESKGPVRIGRNVFIGFGASVLPGVTLGDNCVVGARSVVTRSYPAYSMVAGMPARLVKTFDFDLQQWVPVAGNSDK